MKVLVFGQSGQVGRELRAAQTDLTLQSLSRSEADFENPELCAEHVARTDADAVIIAAAYTQVDKAEEDETRAALVNAQTPGAIARAAAERDIPVVHISTDYVFDGQGDVPFSTSHPVAPLGAYGRTKEAGEALVRASGATHAILRTSWVFSPFGSNFVKTMLRLGAERDTLNIVADQVGGPTPASDIAGACLSIAEQLIDDKSKSGTYHFSGAPDVSWADFARAIFDHAGVSCNVNDIATTDYPTPAARPLNSRLDTRATVETFGLARPQWANALGAVLQARDT
ncbi:MAG: dTDP-4-dehydrorhamnose reductase [Pseudomonadota bacterium]